MDRPIKLLYLITCLGRGGAERSITDLALQFKNNPEIVVKIGVLDNVNAFPELEHVLDIHFLEYQPNSLWKKSFTPKYHELVKDFQPDIIHSNRFLAEFITTEKLYPNTIYVCHGRDNMIQLKNWQWSNLKNKGNLINWLEKQILINKKYKKTNTHFIANSEDTCAYFQKVLLKKDRKNVQIIYNAVDLEKFAVAEEKTIDPKKPLQLINVGSFQAKKNQIFLIAIAKYLKAQKIDFELNLLGDGSEKSNVANAIKANGLENHVFLRGVQNNVEDWLKKSDVYIHSAYYEPFGIVLLEAMAAGLPLICLDGIGNRILIEQGKNGFMFPHEDAALFGDTIIQLLQNPAQYAEISNYAKSFTKKFDIIKKADEYLVYYKNLLKQNVN